MSRKSSRGGVGSTVIIVWVMTIKGPIKNLWVGTVGTGKRCPVEILLCAGAGDFTVIGLICTIKQVHLEDAVGSECRQGLM